MSGSLDHFFTYHGLVFSRRNVVCPPQPYVVISTCLTYVYSYLNKFAPWKWQVRRWPTAGFRSVCIELLYPPISSPAPPCINSLPPPLPPRLHAPGPTLPMIDCLKLPGETLTHIISTMLVLLFCFKTYLFRPP
jgi:hypothetical protein